MTVQIQINGVDAQEVIHELSVLASHLSFPAVANAATASDSEAPKAEKPARGRSAAKASEPAKGTPTTSEEPKGETHGESDSAPVEDKPAEESPAPTIVELRAKAQEVGITPEVKKAIKTLLDEFKSKSISDVPEEKRAAFLARLEDLGKPIDISDDDLPY